MYSKILSLRFPKTEVQKPIVCYLVRDYGLIFNILNAAVTPRKEGVMVLELSGDPESFKEGLKYLKRQGVVVQNASQEVTRNEERCTQCGACTAVCPTSALYIQRPQMEVIFQAQKCSLCELCVSACPTRSMGVRPTQQALEE